MKSSSCSTSYSLIQVILVGSSAHITPPRSNSMKMYPQIRDPIIQNKIQFKGRQKLNPMQLTKRNNLQLNTSAYSIRSDPNKRRGIQMTVGRSRARVGCLQGRMSMSARQPTQIIKRHEKVSLSKFIIFDVDRAQWELLKQSDLVLPPFLATANPQQNHQNHPEKIEDHAQTTTNKKYDGIEQAFCPLSPEKSRSIMAVKRNNTFERSRDLVKWKAITNCD